MLDTEGRAPLCPTESSVVHGVVSRGGRLQLSRLQPAEARKDFVCALHLLSSSQGSPFRCPGPHCTPASVPPRIQSLGAAQEHHILEGQEARLDCEANGQPPPDVAWLKDGSPLGQDMGSHLR
ncbi:Hemicentin-2 [Saguinus oedipus]|uniref:Hemicentin-2 n=1 Tax=Saguinus oedipus TaxID=9490 RepID=A0ABQ9WHK3_SAGOE|nr:Hemicentin-2 [Saguinus oedipus]